ncbi:MAG: hypothetical protein A2854_01230 [Parcubacteria group bacterium RIFCSPHIGHO2_01_FULL_56_18]|nr:MAG: hypothetical protein A2854_01230 [Parcubacteria group bacterium RIFCSPHIGHO2_01_FULL_56_18]
MEYADTALPIMRELREILVPQWGNARARYKPGPMQSMVTDSDMVAERHVASRLHELYPDIVFVGEEGDGDRSARRFWLMDPIDGTVQFVNGEPECTSMLALIEEGQVRFSVIYDFLNDAMYWAERGKGAYREHERLAASRVADLKDARVIGEVRREKEENLRLIEKLEGMTQFVRSKVAGWEFIQVACGAYDARICFDPYGYDYDFAPGSLLVSEAGGTVVNMSGRGYDYRDTNFYAGSSHLARYFTSAMLFPTASIQ